MFDGMAKGGETLRPWCRAGFAECFDVHPSVKPPRRRLRVGGVEKPRHHINVLGDLGPVLPGTENRYVTRRTTWPFTLSNRTETFGV